MLVLLMLMLRKFMLQMFIMLMLLTYNARHIDSHVKIASVPKAKTKSASNDPYVSYHNFDATYVLTVNLARFLPVMLD